MTSRPLADALDRARVEFRSERKLADELDIDAAMALANSGDLDDVLVRLLELITHDRMERRAPAEVFDLLVASDWEQWDMPAVQAIAGWADAWWITALLSEPDLVVAGDVLGQLVHLGLPMVRWLSVWLDHLDGPGAAHLANVVIDGSSDPAWQEFDDQYRTLQAWCRSEPVVNGLTMIGGVHLGPGQFSEVLDRVLAPELT